MRQDRIARTCALIALLAAVTAAPARSGAVASNPGAAPAIVLTGKSGEALATSKKTSARARLHQWTGYVVDLDKNGFTVEKPGKTPRSKAFVRDEEMETEGDIEEGARVTVYYRETDDELVAHRVVVKDPPESSEDEE